MIPSENTPAVTAKPLPPGGVEIAGTAYMTDAQGRLVPLGLVPAQDLLMHEVVHKILGYARPLSEEIARFKAHTFDDVDGFVSLLEQEYGQRVGGKKGNITLMTFDGLRKVQVQAADLIEFGPELQIAKGLLDECLREWAAESREEIQAVVGRAFKVDQQGQINRAELLSILRLEIKDERWVRAMDAIRASMRVVGSKRYVRFYERDKQDGDWRAVTLDVAVA